MTATTQLPSRTDAPRMAARHTHASSLDNVPVIVGAGLAGLTAALAMAPQPCVVITPHTWEPLPSGGPSNSWGADPASGWAQGGIAAALAPGDSAAAHARDTIQAGDGLCDAEVVTDICANAPRAIAWLRSLGAQFDTHPDGTLRLGREGGHGVNRIVHAAGDGTGREVLRAVMARAAATPSITVLDRTQVTRIVVADGRVAGADILMGGTQRTIRTAHVVLATGGAGALFSRTTNPLGSYGGGLGLAARAGAALRDLEMVQFHPTALDVGRDPMPLVSEAVRGDGAILVTRDGTPIIDNPLSTRDIVSRAVFAAMGRGEQVFIDARDALGSRFAEHFPGIAASCLSAGIDPATDLVPISPAAHYHMGGVVVDHHGATSVPGLWACGEVTNTGLHGANRLASNSLLEAVVCGRLVGRDIAAHAGLRAPRIHPAHHHPKAIITPEAMASLRATMFTHVGVIRSADSLRAAAAHLGLGDLPSPGPYAPITLPPRRAARLSDAELVAALIVRSAQARTESRGGHYRSDYPRRSSTPYHTTAQLTPVKESLHVTA